MRHCIQGLIFVFFILSETKSHAVGVHKLAPITNHTTSDSGDNEALAPIGPNCSENICHAKIVDIKRMSAPGSKDADKECIQIKEYLSGAKKPLKPVLVKFTATWCGPCRMQEAELKVLLAEAPYKDKFELIHVDFDACTDIVKAFLGSEPGLPILMRFDDKKDFQSRKARKVIGGFKAGEAESILQ